MGKLLFFDIMFKFGLGLLNEGLVFQVNVPCKNKQLLKRFRPLQKKTAFIFLGGFELLVLFYDF